MDKNIGARIKKIMDYLQLTPPKFAKNCGLSNYTVLNGYISGAYIPTLGTINKIIERYPINKEWLIDGEGAMWKYDYFKRRIRDYGESPKSTPEKLKAISEIYEISNGEVIKRSKIPRGTYWDMMRGVYELNDERILKLREAFPEIPLSWYK